MELNVHYVKIPSQRRGVIAPFVSAYPSKTSLFPEN